MRLLVCVLTLFLSGCASLYFQTLDEAPVVPVRSTSDWPWQEYWTGIVFNGEKIGFSNQQFVPDQGQYRISSEAALRIRFLMIDKEFAAISHDWVDEALQLKKFEYKYNIDNSQRLIKGHTDGGQLMLEVTSQDHVDRKVLQYSGELVPINAIYLYPVLHGLQVDKTYNFQIFDGESLAIHPVEQRIVAYQSSDLFTGKAFKVKTETMGLTTTTWIDVNGLPQFELSLRGTLISALEPEKYAKEYLTQAALSKSEHLLTYSLIPVANKIENPRDLQFMSAHISGMPETFEMMNTAQQQCNRETRGWLCKVSSDQYPADLAIDKESNLKSSFTINSNARQIKQLAEEITGPSKDADDQVSRILAWLDANIEKKVVDSFNSLDVLRQREAECQGHSMLFAALARNRGIPTRLVNGVVYSQEYDSFLYHTWVESYINGRWQAIDPTFGQRHADATHIVLIEGEDLAELTALLPLVGKLEIELD